MNFHTPRIPDVEQEAIRIAAWIRDNPAGEIHYAGASDSHAKAVMNRVLEILNGSPFRVAAYFSKWFSIFGTKG